MSPSRKGLEPSSNFVDARGEGRGMRVTWHLDGPRSSDPDGEGLVVLSLWRDNVCAGSFRLASREVPALVEMLTRGLSAQYDDLRTDTATVSVPGPTALYGDTA